MYNSETIGGVINALRKTRTNLSQAELCKELGITQGTLSKIENGTLELKGVALLKLLRHFKLSSDEFMTLMDTYIKITLKEQKLAEKDRRKKARSKIANLLQETA